MKETLILISVLIAFYCLAPFLIIPFRKKDKGQRNIWLFSLAAGLVFVFLTVLLLPRFPSFMPAQNQALDVLSSIPPPEKEKKREEMFLDNFLFIDNSFSVQKVPLPERNVFDSSSSIAITDRAELATLLNTLADADSLVDLIICDIYFDQPHENDSLLHAAFARPEVARKLLMSHNFQQPNLPLFASLPDSVYGNVVENGESNFFSSYSLFHEGRPSLSALIAQRITGGRLKPLWGGNTLVKEQFPSGKVKYGVNRFLPKFDFTDEQHFLREDIAIKHNDASFQPAYKVLGDATRESGGEDLLILLEDRKRQHKKNYVFIGAFKSKEDQHDTFFGKLSGPAIILNLTYAILSGQQVIGIGYLFYLWLALSYILVVLIKLSLDIEFIYPLKNRLNRKKFAWKKAGTVKKKSHGKLRNGLAKILRLVFIEEMHLWLVVVLVIATVLLWGRLINAFGLLLFFLGLYKIMEPPKEETEHPGE